MEYFSNGEVFMGSIGNSKKSMVSYVDTGDFRISFDENETFIVCRKDGCVLNGTEDLHALTYENGSLLPLIFSKYEEMVSNIVGSYIYHLVNPRPFIEFDLKIADDNSKMVIYPVYLDNTPNIKIDMETSLDQELGDSGLGLSFGIVKELRNVIIGDKVISGEEKSSALVKKLKLPNL